jgi:hypothetical protein
LETDTKKEEALMDRREWIPIRIAAQKYCVTVYELEAWMRAGILSRCREIGFVHEPELKALMEGATNVECDGQPDTA